MSQTLQALPPFINDRFVLKVLLAVGGEATRAEIADYMQRTYDLRAFPHALKYMMTQYSNLQGSGYLDSRRSKTRPTDIRLFITDEARPFVDRIVRE